uniref:Retrotransposon Copia-like N-terminal domain-containing protein n=1 Tax=Salix viminalis TaxID=40686 RepID=A0A6N2LGP4_SALVM
MGIDGSESRPPKFTSTEHKNQGIVNPGYVVWQYKDQIVLGWIISSLSPAVVSTIYGLETSRLAWQALGARFAAPSTSRISLIKRKLQSLQQGSMQCQEFLDAVKTLADELSAVGKPIEDSDLILSVLNGLNSSFHSFVTTYMLMAKEKSMSFSDFHAELLNFDLMQKFHSHNIQQETGSYAFYSHKTAPKTAPYTDLNSPAPPQLTIDGIDNSIPQSLSNSSQGTIPNNSPDPTSSCSSIAEIPLAQPSSRMVTRSQTGHSAPRLRGCLMVSYCNSNSSLELSVNARLILISCNT